MNILGKALLHLLVYAAVLSLAFVYIAQLSVRQSVVLALLFAFVLDGVIHAAPKPTLRFTPYWVRICPQWHEILTDFKLVQSTDEWLTVQESVNSRERQSFSVFHDALWFSILRLPSQTESSLIYLNSFKTFVGEVNLLEDLDPIAAIKEDEQNEFLRKQKVRFFVKGKLDGYELGLEVPDWWWEKHKASCPPVIAEEKLHMFGMTKIAVAVLPYSEFAVYWDMIDWNSKFIEGVHKNQDDQRKKFHWAASKQDDDVFLRAPWTEIRNKYFEVHHKEV